MFIQVVACFVAFVVCIMCVCVCSLVCTCRNPNVPEKSVFPTDFNRVEPHLSTEVDLTARCPSLRVWVDVFPDPLSQIGPKLLDLKLLSTDSSNLAFLIASLHAFFLYLPVSFCLFVLTSSRWLIALQLPWNMAAS